MSEQHTLEMFERDTTVTPRQLRDAGYIPATIYGKGVEPVSIQVNTHDFTVALTHGKRLFKLEGFGKSFEVEVHQLQKVSTKEVILHVEFLVPSEASTKKKNAARAKAEEERRIRQLQLEKKAARKMLEPESTPAADGAPADAPPADGAPPAEAEKKEEVGVS